MDPKIWGPNFWFTLHTITLGYPNNPTHEDKRRYNDFFTSVKNVLPCPKCRLHYEEHLSQYPIAVSLDNKDYLVKWLFDLHNKVNLSLNKSLFSYEDFTDKYRRIFNPTILSVKPSECNYKVIILLIIVISLFGYIFYQYQKKKKNAKLLFN